MNKTIIPKQNYIKRASGIYVSDRLVYDNTGKKVTKIQGEEEINISPIWPLTIFRYMPFSRLYTELERKTMTFISPELWTDPFEKAFNTSSKGFNLKCLCFTFNGSLGEEWAWKAFSNSEQLVRIEILFEKLVDALSVASSQNGNKWDFYISVCDYSLDKRSIISIINQNKKAAKTNNILDCLNMMSIKRKAFSYEKEIRVFAVPKDNNTESTLQIKKVDYKNFITRVLLEPLEPFQDDLRTKFYSQLQLIHNAGIKEYFTKQKIKVQQSHLYEIK